MSDVVPSQPAVAPNSTVPRTATAAEIAALRDQHYNATVERRIDVTEGLAILRIRPDRPYPSFAAGQYTTLGLGAWEPRADGVPGEWDPGSVAKSHTPLVRRAYSISCPVFNEAGDLVSCPDLPFLEFYVALIARVSDHPPMLTPRLFALQEGSRLHMGPRAHGHYTTDGVQPTDDVTFFATGTGEAPHTAMIAELLARGHTGRIVSAVCVRRRTDLGYLESQRELEKRFPNFKYLTLTTREPENLDSSLPGYVGTQYLQDFAASGRLETKLGYKLHPDTSHVFLCGNPGMIGVPHKAQDGHWVFPEPPGLVEVFSHRGFRFEPKDAVNIHFEKYW